MKPKKNCELCLLGGHDQDYPTIDSGGVLGVAFSQKQFKNLCPYLLTGASAS